MNIPLLTVWCGDKAPREHLRGFAIHNQPQPGSEEDKSLHDT